MYTAKKVQENNFINDRYELFTVKTLLDINANEVQILESIGSYSLQELNEQKNSLLAQIDLIDVKINSIIQINS